MMLAMDSKGITFWLVKLHNKNTFMGGFNSLYGSHTISSPTLEDNEPQFGTYAISKTEASYLNTGDWSCTDEEEVQIEHCVDEFYAAELGCTFSWMTNTNASYPDCDSDLKYRRYLKIAADLRQMGEQAVAARIAIRRSLKDLHYTHL